MVRYAYRRRSRGTQTVVCSEGGRGGVRRARNREWERVKNLALMQRLSFWSDLMPGQNTGVVAADRARAGIPWLVRDCSRRTGKRVGYVELKIHHSDKATQVVDTSVGNPKDEHPLGARQSVFCVAGFSGPTRARYCAFNPISSRLGVLSRGWSRDVARIKGARA